MRRLFIFMLAVAVVPAGCSSGDSSTPDTGLPPDVARCEELDPLVLDFLRSGLVVDDAVLPWGYSVKSTDYVDVWIVTAGVESGGELDYGTWAIRAGTWPTDYVGAVTVDEIAAEITDFGADSDIIVSDATNGVYSAVACAIARLGTEGSG
jgi:hypothetical protein